MNEDAKTAAFLKLCAQVEQAPPVTGILMTDVLTLPDELRRFLGWILRQKLADKAEIAFFLEQEENAVQELLSLLTEKGYLETQADAACTYRARTRQSGGPSANLSQKPRKDLLALLGDGNEEE